MTQPLNAEEIAELTVYINTLDTGSREPTQTARLLATIQALQAEIEGMKISDDDAKEVRRMLDDIDVWDGADRAIDRMLSLFPNDPLNAALSSNKETP